MAIKDAIKQSGVITTALGNSNFRVELENGVEILCTISGKIRMNYIKLLPGDNVEVEISPYDLTKGRISRRLRK